MFPRAGMMMGAARPFRYIASSTQTGTSSSIAVSYSGVSVGNLCIIAVVGPSGAASASGYSTQQSYSFISGGGVNVIAFIYKVLTGADITAGAVTVTTGGNYQAIMALFYDGCTVATLKSSNDVIDTNVMVTGFTKAGASKAILTIGGDRGLGSLAVPSGFAARVASFSSGVSTAAAGELIAANYTNGSNKTWTGGAGTNSFGASLIELA